MQRKIAVIGAGAVGLSTAVQIQQFDASASVTLIADKFTTETTSHGAAGIFRPSADKFSGAQGPQLKSVLHHCQFDITFTGFYRNSVCLSVRLSHSRGLCPHGSTYDHDFFTIW